MAETIPFAESITQEMSVTKDEIDVTESTAKNSKKRARVEAGAVADDIPTPKKPKHADAKSAATNRLEKSLAFREVPLDHYEGLVFLHSDDSSVDDIRLFTNDLCQIKVVTPKNYSFCYTGSRALSHKMSNGMSMRITHGTKCSVVDNVRKYTFIHSINPTSATFHF